jgi:phosphate transport system substrate-binding protein
MEAAVANADFSKVQDFYLILTDQPGEKSWPITAATYILLRRDNPADQNHEVLKFFYWALNDGQADAKKLDYVPLPPSVIKQIEEHWSKVLGDAWKTASAK